MIYRAVINSWGGQPASTHITFSAATPKVADCVVALLGLDGEFSPSDGSRRTMAAAGMIRRPDGARDSSVLLTTLHRAMKSMDVMCALWSLAPVSADDRNAHFERIGYLTVSQDSPERVYHRAFSVWMEMELPPDIVVALTRAYVLADVISTHVKGVTTATAAG